jgi:hypothetical protein
LTTGHSISDSPPVVWVTRVIETGRKTRRQR